MTESTLQRFHRAQEPVYPEVLAQLQAGRKTSHWMWFIFPQLAGLGHSEAARLYALASIDEARAYLADPVLGARLAECTRLLLRWRERPLTAILGEIDALKFRSSMTLFAHAAGAGPSPFRDALGAFCAGPDARTLALLGLPGAES